VDEIRVGSWRELDDVLADGSWDDRLGRHRSRFAYRGSSDVRRGLRTSLMRLGGDYPAVERNLLRNFRKYAVPHAGRPDSPWNWLSLAQHHGAPTRLLDWSYSPMIAAHFATADADRTERDAVVWAVNFVEAHAHLPPTLRKLLDAEGSEIVTVEILDEASDGLEAFDALADHPFVAFFEPPSFDERILGQWALFAVMSDPTVSLDTWLDEHRDVTARRIVVPAELKWEVRDHLDMAGINERTLFPGLDGLSRWLARYYAAREAERRDAGDPAAM
jgi:hypothetical protein